MSVMSRKSGSRATHVSSIFSVSSIQDTINSTKATTKVRFQLPHSKKVRTILQDKLNDVNVEDYINLVLIIHNSELFNEDILSLLNEATQCISLLNHELHLFVEAILSLKWTLCDRNVIREYQSFLLNLISAHNYHAKYAIDRLVCNFIPDKDKLEWDNGVPADEDCAKYVSIHLVFNILLDVVPMCRHILIQSLALNFPYMKNSTHIHEVYMHNLLWILDYKPMLRPEILRLIFTKLVVLDVNSTGNSNMIENEYQESIFTMDDNFKMESAHETIAHTLDICLDKVFNYFITECHVETGELCWDKAKGLYQDMIGVFDQIILPTYNTHCVQFAMFTLCCIKTSIAEAFLNYLWKKVCTPNVASVLRQTAVSYIASLVARGSFVPMQMLQGTIQEMSSWIHSYIESQDGIEFVCADVRVHKVFFSVCQALFYVIAFRQKDLLNTRKNISFLESMNLGKMVTCRLNPLRVCQPAVVQNFAAVTRAYQLAYCYSVLEHNSRNILPTIYQDEKGHIITADHFLDAFFPFDPYSLNRSSDKISPFYLNYQEPSLDYMYELKERIDEDDDFLCDQNESSKNKGLFSYGTSPGFKQT